MRNSYHVGDKVLWRGRVCIVVARYDRLCHGGIIPLLQPVYRLKYVQPQYDGLTPHGKYQPIAWADELTLLPPRKRGKRRTVHYPKEYQVL
jgi:hypothetical protein